MQKKVHWCFFAFYLAIFGAFCGLEVDTFIEDLPFFQISTFLLLFNVLFILLIPPLLYALFSSIRSMQDNRAARTGMLVLNSIYFHIVVLLLLYKSARNMDFDFYFFWYNISVAVSVLWRLYAPWMILIILSLAVFALIQKPAFSPISRYFRKMPRKISIFAITLIFSSALCQFFTMDSVRGSTAGFLYSSFLSDRQLRTDYRELYADHIKTLQIKSPTLPDQVAPLVLGDIVIFVQQESLSSLLIDPRITPQLLRASREGILLREFYGNSIQSARGYECILCGVPPSIEGALVDEYASEEIENLSCLPRIFKKLGYYPIVFYSGNQNPRVTNFFDFIGFEKILASEIMHPGDTMYDWGYREDTFFTRVDEYLQTHYVGEKLFVFITASATNHTPFEVLDKRFLDKVPFPRPKKFEEHLSNTTFVQDSYFGHLYDIFKKNYAHRGSLVAVSDHSWPIEIHKHNIYNERGAYEENFLAAMLLIPPSSGIQDFAKGTTITHRYSQMDIAPTVLDLLGLQQNYLLGESFAPWLLESQGHKRSLPQKTKISIQPYGGGFVSAVRYPKKYLFDVLGQNVKIYDLEKDPKEQSPSSHDTEEFMYLIADFFQNESRN